MPTAETYWSAAAEFAGIAAELARTAPRLAAHRPDTAVQGATPTITLEQAVDEIVDGTGTSAAGYERLAAECRRRAVACEMYTAALGEYRIAHESWASAPIGERPPAPEPPLRDDWMQPG